ncbi:serine/threonine-protein kinase [Polyangium jinanense]|uniref:serine/threonine-protein kinase n=1 Tax=Polyangium jinanense TaxID=2829994 RepID=UPI0027E36EF6|nr:serine/threonine-protein kinase [Polyangium jinanense]
MDCIDATTVLSFVRGVLSEQEATRVEGHIDRCAECRRALVEFARSSLFADEVGAAPTIAPLGALDSHHAPIPAALLPRGTLVGRYLLLDCLGMGGMGVVHAAYDPELDRKVALKILRPEVIEQLGVEGSRVRILREAQAMARLSHPNVITVHDCGTVGEHVFVAMELLDGQTLTQWIRERPRKTREVLDRFVLAGRGLAAAHAAGLIHRDFKPDNVLCGQDGRVCVTDFGLARATLGTTPGQQEERDEEVLPALDGVQPTRLLAAHLTRSGALVGTPAYMAPEQVEGASVDARSDQFSFCVALYEALYGERPFTGDTYKSLLASISRGLPRAAPKSRRIPKRIHQALLRGLSAEPAERFPSMDELLSTLTHDPRARLRRIALFAGTALALGVSVLFAFVREKPAATPPRLCQGAEQNLAGVWDQAQKQSVRDAFLATRVSFASDAWQGVERAFDAYTSKWVAMHTDACEATHMRGEQSESLLDLRMQCLKDRLQEVKALTTEFQRANAKTVEKAVEAAGNVAPVELCARTDLLTMPVRPPSDPTARAKVDELRGRLAEAKALTRTGQYKESLALTRQITEEARLLGYRPLEAEALLERGILEQDVEVKASAQTLTEAALAAEAGRHDRVAARAQMELFYVIGGQQARFDEAMGIHRAARAALERIGGDKAFETDLLMYEGYTLRQQGDMMQAVDRYKRVLELRLELLGPDNINVARVHAELATTYLNQGIRFDEAHHALQRALDIYVKDLGPTHPRTAGMRRRIAVALFGKCRYAEAITLLQNALPLIDQSYGQYNRDTAQTLYVIGLALFEQGKAEESISYVNRALDIWRKTHDDHSTAIADATEVLGHAHVYTGQLEKARGYCQRAHSIMEAKMGKESARLALATLCLAKVDTEEKLYTSAAARFERSIQLYKKASAVESQNDAIVRLDWGDMLLRADKPLQALPHFQRALGIMEKVGGPEHSSLAEVLTPIGKALLALHRPQEALAPLERALALCEAPTWEGRPEVLANARFFLARALWEGKGDRDRALTLANAAKGAFARSTKANIPEAAELNRWLATRPRH